MRVAVHKTQSDHSEIPFTLSQQEKAIPLSLCSNVVGLENYILEYLKLGWYLTMSSNTSGSDPPIIDRGQRSGNLLSLDTVKQADQERKGKT